MKLLTHNILMCVKKGCTEEHFPLKIEVVKATQVRSDFNEGFIRNMLSRLHWPALVMAGRDVNLNIPPEMPATPDEAFLRALHDVLFDFHIEEGTLLCRNCGHRYPIKNGIPNMLLAEDQVPTPKTKSPTTTNSTSASASASTTTSTTTSTSTSTSPSSPPIEPSDSTATTSTSNSTSTSAVPPQENS
ncbi:Multifunctional methyltransferase subunit TRM112 [Pelomyxa schiedti]|nr:Multifunctional methyltransferase subunit TRM112 [Pelomyxa schiedti]